MGRGTDEGGSGGERERGREGEREGGHAWILSETGRLPSSVSRNSVMCLWAVPWYSRPTAIMAAVWATGETSTSAKERREGI